MFGARSSAGKLFHAPRPWADVTKASAYSCQHRLWHAGVGEFGERKRIKYRLLIGIDVQ